MTVAPTLDLEALRAYFASREDVIFAYLFGSHARGQAGPLSDVDIAVFLDPTACPDLFRARLQIMADLTSVLHTDEVDIAVLNETPLALNYRVLRDGVLLYCRDRQAMVEHKARTVSEYLDFLPILERHNRAIIERAARGELFNGFNPHRGALERHRQLRERLAREAEAHP